LTDGIYIDDVEDDIPDGPEERPRDRLVGMEYIVTPSSFHAEDNKTRDPSKEVRQECSAASLRTNPIII